MRFRQKSLKALSAPLRRSGGAEASGFTAEGFQPNGPEGADGAENAVLILVGEQEQMCYDFVIMLLTERGGGGGGRKRGGGGGGGGRRMRARLSD